MARLRKPCPDEPTIFQPPVETRATRSSPRKLAPRAASSEEDNNAVFLPTPSGRKLRYTYASSENADEPLLVPKTNTHADALSPRKQRILRTVESNSRLLRKMSNDTLASPEKKQRERRVRSGTTDTDVGKRGRLLYTKTLARSVVTKQAKTSDKSAATEAAMYTDLQYADSEDQVKQERMDVSTEEDNEAETSLWCDDEQVPHTAHEEKSHTEHDDKDEEESEEEDEDPVVTLKHRRRQATSRRIVSDSDEDTEDEMQGEEDVQHEIPSSRLTEMKAPQAHVADEPPNLTSMRPPHRKGHTSITNWAQEVVDLTSSPGSLTSFVLPTSTRVRTASLAASRPTSSTSNSAQAILTYSPTPTKQRSPHKAPPISRPSTPPHALPSPSKLVSPSKKKTTIPRAAHIDGRPSLDAFWNPTDVNEWNEHHSPVKPLVSPKKQKWRDDIKMMEGVALEDSSDESYQSPTTSPKKKSISRSPVKKQTSQIDATTSVKEIRAQRKAFSEQKHAIATSFLHELDTTIASDRITTLSAATGGVKLVWSKTLKTTAGRANWRREQIRIRAGPLPSDTRLEIRHHCSIELAEKVIDDTERLYNVLAHEFCHLTTFMISEVRNNPHGAEFKSWGRKATQAFAHKGVEVTTKHSYQIEYKYIWECVECGYEFKRHSKSVDTQRHSCGRCKGKLVQTKPVPRGGGGGGGNGGNEKREKSEYQVFVKAHFARVKKELEAKGLDAQMGKVMEAVAREYREAKSRNGKTEKLVVDVDALDEVELALGDLKI